MVNLPAKRQVRNTVVWRGQCLALSVLCVVWLAAPGLAQAEPGLSSDSETCVSCHEVANPGLVADWRSSRHARRSVSQGLAEQPLARRVSVAEVPEGLADHVVGCLECHGQHPDRHADTFEHYGYQVHTVVTPQDCAVCHPQEEEQYGRSKKAHARGNLLQNPVYHGLVQASTRLQSFADGTLTPGESPIEAQSETCLACHGTEIKVVGTRSIETELGEIEVPVLSGWPNQGVGRLNPDGSLGSCSACHARHSFDIKVARSPETCSECHLEPDVPAWEVYRESKHGNLFMAHRGQQNLDAVPWQPGVDFTSPTCATCHNSLLVNAEGTVLAERNHDFGARLWVRIFGLPYSHPQPATGETYTLRNKAGLPLPVDLDGTPAATGLIDAAEQAKRQQSMERVCSGCHSSSWIGGHFANFDKTVVNSDRMVKASTDLMQHAWQAGLADPADMFDEPLEQTWTESWLFHATTLRYAAAMCGPDYAAFKSGWWKLQRDLAEMKAAIAGK